MEHQSSTLVAEQIVDQILVLAFNAPHHHNPFSAEMERAVARSLKAANANDAVQAVIITGGRQRSFSVGGDFNEVKGFEGGGEVDEWIDDIIAMYTACLEVEKPTVAALDNYAIGIGFQLAVCCDYRLASSRAQLIMPELKNGIACVLGQYMLERMLGRAQMLQIVLGCEPVTVRECLDLGLLNAVCEPDKLHAQAFAMATQLLHYPDVSYRTTKKEINAGFIDGLRAISPAAKAAHRASFKARAAQRFMGQILGKA